MGLEAWRGEEFRIEGSCGLGRRPIFRHMSAFIGREEGQTMPEYAVVLSLLTITAAAVFLALSGGVANAMTTVTGIV